MSTLLLPSQGLLDTSTNSSDGNESGGVSAAILEEVQNQQVQPVEEQQQEQQEQQQIEAILFPEEDLCPYHGWVSFIGRRKEMEDAASAMPDFITLPCGSHSGENPQNQQGRPYHFFGVYDGHGGAQVANFCRDRFHSALAEEVHLSIAANGFTSADNVTNWEVLWEQAMRSCFCKLDAEIEGIAPENVGSTAVVAVVGCCRIIVANCGDSRIVLSRAGKAIPISTDHKPEKKEELERIEAAGGRVIPWNGYRVMGMLAMSRALGDRYLKAFGVISSPDVICIERTDEDEFMVLASDGLWDVLNNELVCDVTRLCFAGRVNNPNAIEGGRLAGQVFGSENSMARLAAAYLTKLAHSRNSSDNISVLVVDLRNLSAAAATTNAATTAIPPTATTPSPTAISETSETSSEISGTS